MHLASDGTVVAPRRSERVAGGEILLQNECLCSRFIVAAAKLVQGAAARSLGGLQRPNFSQSEKSAQVPRARNRASLQACCTRGELRPLIAEKASAAAPSSATPIRIPGISRPSMPERVTTAGVGLGAGVVAAAGGAAVGTAVGAGAAPSSGSVPSSGSAPLSSGGSVPSSGGSAPPSSVEVSGSGSAPSSGVGVGVGSVVVESSGVAVGGRRRLGVVLAAVVVVALDAGLQRLAEVREVAVEVGLDRVQRLLEVVARVVADVDLAVAAVVGVDRLDLLRRVVRRLGRDRRPVARRSRSESASVSARGTQRE